jgi:glutamyl-tRNA reductase
MNSLIVYGLNYHSCPLAIRERFTIPETCLEHALTALKKLPHISEAVVLSTCNRTEVYAVVSDIACGFRELESFFQAARQIADHNVLQADFKLLRDDVALHLFRVASGLDSMVLG